MLSYETGDHFKTENYVQLFKQYIYTHKTIPEDIKTAYLNYLKFVQILFNVQTSNDKYLLQKNLIKLKSTKSVENKKWLIKRFEALK